MVETPPQLRPREWPLVGWCERDLADHLAVAVRRFGRAALGVIDLPPLGADRIEPAQLRAAAVLYFCRELEHAGLLTMVETLARRVRDGSLALPLGGSAHALMRVARRDRERFSAPERAAVYAQVLGEDSDALIEAFSRVISEIGRQPGGQRPDLAARAEFAASQLGGVLSARATGIAAYAARDIVAQIKESISLLSDPGLAQALGGGGLGSIVQRWAPRLLGRRVAFAYRVGRAEDGAALLRWIAAHSSALPGAARQLSAGDPLVAAAERWCLSRRGA